MKKYLLFVLIMAITLPMSGQEFTSLQSESSMKITGTSTLHDWNIDVNSFSAKAVLVGESIEKVEFSAEVESLKSGTSSMDKNTYKALNADKYPTIKFKGQNMTGSNGNTNIKGDLTISGVTKPIAFKATQERWAEQSMSFKGTYTFKMSDFGIDPPRAMLGTIRTGDEINIDFKIVMYQ